MSDTQWAYSASGRQDRVKAHIMVDGVVICGNVGMVKDLVNGDGGKSKCSRCLNTRSLAERFNDKVEATGHDGCHIWTAGVDSHGYGVIGFDGRHLGAHRVAWFLEYGVWPSMLLHSCDTPRCMNVAHLREGTHAENMADRSQRGRTNSKLNHAKVRQIRRLLKAGMVQREICEMFGVTNVAISNISTRTTWRHVA